MSGVTVSVNGQNKSVTTGADGIYEFSLAAGSYTLTASKAGYQNATVTRTLGAGTTVWGSMELKTGTPGSTDTVPPTVEIMFPGGGVALDLAVLTLTGTATDDQGALSEVTVSINQGAPAKAGVTGGKFSQQIKLFPGLNTIEVSATDAAGNTAVDSAQATFRAGVSGFVHVTEDEAARIPDVTVRLLRPSNGEVVGTAVSGADGSFSFDVSEVNVDFVLTVKAQGFLTRAETVTISDEERVSLHIPMTEGEDPNPSDVDIRFIEPVDGATVTGEQVTVYGSVDGFPVVAVVVNEVTAELVGAGGFAASIPLKEGENTIEALATGVSGETIVGTIRDHPQGRRFGRGQRGQGRLRRGPGPGAVRAAGCAPAAPPTSPIRVPYRGTSTRSEAGRTPNSIGVSPRSSPSTSSSWAGSASSRTRVARKWVTAGCSRCLPRTSSTPTRNSVHRSWTRPRAGSASSGNAV